MSVQPSPPHLCLTNCLSLTLGTNAVLSSESSSLTISALIAVSRADLARPITLPDLRAKCGQQRTLQSGCHEGRDVLGSTAPIWPILANAFSIAKEFWELVCTSLYASQPKDRRVLATPSLRSASLRGLGSYTEPLLSLNAFNHCGVIVWATFGGFQ